MSTASITRQKAQFHIWYKSHSDGNRWCKVSPKLYTIADARVDIERFKYGYPADTEFKVCYKSVNPNRGN